MKTTRLKKIVNISKNLTVKSAFNLVINQFEYGRQSSILYSLPQVIDVVLTTNCNLKCIFCKNYETLGTKYISIENFEKIGKQLFPTARRVSFCSGGEPYMHKQLIDLLRIIKRYKLETWVLSNGMLLNEKIIRTIVKEELITKHGFSVDGINASTVESIRINAKLDVILENIKRLIRIRDEEGKQKPNITIRYALMHSNIKELPDAVRYWGEMGINNLSCSYLSLCNGIDHQESLFFHQDLAKKIFNEARKVASCYQHLTIDLPSTAFHERQNQHAPNNCTSPWKFVMINTDGRILPCYKSWGIISMGNFYEDNVTFKKIWNSSQFQALRCTVNNDTLQKQYPYCSVCESRFGTGSIAVHLGDEIWLNQIQDEAERNKLISFRSRNRREK